jgi:xanthine dehydrogenase YagS FAD-binding subunit
MRQYNLIKARSIDDAISLLSKEKNNTKIIAGGMDLLSLMKDDILIPTVLVDINETKLDYIYEDSDYLHIGAGITLTELLKNPIIRQKYPLLIQTVRNIANIQVRNRATVAGDLLQRPRCAYFRGPFKCLRKSGDTCYALKANNKYHCIIGGGPCFIVHPSDLATALLALEAKLIVKSSKKEKTLAISEFFVLPKINPKIENIIAPDEIMIEIRIPAYYAMKNAVFLKVRERKTGDYGLMSIAMLQFDETTNKKDVKVVVGQIAPMPWRAISAEEILQRGLSAKDVNAAAAKILQEAEPLSENEYKTHLLKGILAEAIDALNDRT